jgi:hypothetical protein
MRQQISLAVYLLLNARASAQFFYKESEPTIGLDDIERAEYLMN